MDLWVKHKVSENKSVGRDDKNARLIEKINSVERSFESHLVSKDVDHYKKLVPEIDYQFTACAPIIEGQDAQNNNLASPYKHVRAEPLSKVPILIASVYHPILLLELHKLNHIEILKREPYCEAW